MDEEYFVTAFVPSDTACLASSPGRMSLTLRDSKSAKYFDTMSSGSTHDVWISREEMVDFLLYAASLDASVATRSKMSECRIDKRGQSSKLGASLPLTKEFKMDMARLEMPVSGCTCLRTKDMSVGAIHLSCADPKTGPTQ